MDDGLIRSQIEEILEQHDSRLQAQADVYLLVSPLVIAMMQERAYELLGIDDPSALMRGNIEKIIFKIRSHVPELSLRLITALDVQQQAILYAENLMEFISSSDRYTLPRINNFKRDSLGQFQAEDLEMDAFTYQKIMKEAAQQVKTRLEEGMEREHYILDLAA